MYDVTITVKRDGAPSPLNVRGVSAERAQEIIDQMHRAWGMPLPDQLAAVVFLKNLEHHGECRHESEHCRVTVVRSA